MKHCQTFEMDGETFEVEWHDESPFDLQADWVSGPNPDYGFSQNGGGSPLERSDIEHALRDFIKQMSLKTGYIDEDY